MVYGIYTGGRRGGGGRLLPNSRAIVLHQGGQCRWARGMKGWLNLVQTTRGKQYRVKANQQGRYGGLGSPAERGCRVGRNDICVVVCVCVCMYIYV